MDVGVYSLVGLSGVLVLAVACFLRKTGFDIGQEMQRQLQRSAETIRGELGH